jgi:uncharacterized phage protein (predicted DNA packaging)
MTAVIDVANIKAHLNVTTDTDDDLLAEKIDAAQECVEAFIGAKLDAETFPDGVPAPLLEAVRQYAAHLYENREPILVGVNAQELPLNVFDLVGPYRRWCF